MSGTDHKASANNIVRDGRPPRIVVSATSPLLRIVLGSRFGRRIAPLAVLQFDGRRSGRRYRVVVGWHEIDRGPIVFTPAGWRANFANGHAVLVQHRGEVKTMAGTLTTDPEQVAQALNEVLKTGASPRALGLRVPDGHTIAPADVVRMHRGMITLTPE